MTKEEIFKLAEKAGFYLSALDPECGRIWWSDECSLDDELLRFADLVAAAEREACAKVAEDYKESCYAGDLDWYLAKYIVDEIKARGKE